MPAGSSPDVSVWLFSCGPLGESPQSLMASRSTSRSCETATGAIDHRVFPGRLVKSELGFGEKVVVAGVRAPYGDYPAVGRHHDLGPRQIANRIFARSTWPQTLDIPVAEPVGT